MRTSRKRVELRADEHQLYEGRPSWKALMSFYVSGLIAALVLGGILWLTTSAGVGVGVVVVVFALTLVVGYVRRLFTKYLITTRRLRITRGIVRRNVQETRLDRVQNVNYQQSVVDRCSRSARWTSIRRARMTPNSSSNG